MIWLALFGGTALLGLFLHLKSKEPYSREKHMLKAALRNFRIEPRVFSEECLTEVLEVGLMFERRNLSAFEYQKSLSGGILGIAGNIRWICIGEGDCNAMKIKGAVQKGYPQINVFREILAKHDPERFGLEELEMTQTTNRVLSGP